MDEHSFRELEKYIGSIIAANSMFLSSSGLDVSNVQAGYQKGRNGKCSSGRMLQLFKSPSSRNARDANEQLLLTGPSSLTKGIARTTFKSQDKAG